MRGTSRGLTSLEIAIGVSIVACALAATVPACIRAVHFSRTAEATEHVDAILVDATSARESQPQTILASAPLTPVNVARGESVTDPKGTWDGPTWTAIHFKLEDPHWYSYRLDVDPDASTALRVVAQGDLDGDGVLSTFERSATHEGSAIVPRPGLIVEQELE